MSNHSKSNNLLDAVYSLVERSVSEEKLSELRGWALQQLNDLCKKDQFADQAIKKLLALKCEELPLALAIESAIIWKRVQDLFKTIFSEQNQSKYTAIELEFMAAVADKVTPGLSPTSFLHHYQSFIPELHTLIKQIGSRFVQERVLLCAYVEDITGRQHYREISVIISAKTGKTLYEDALGHWRSDNNDNHLNEVSVECLRLLARLLSRAKTSTGV